MIVRGVLVFLVFGLSVLADDLGSLRADRTAIERVYYNHRLGNKPPFEEVVPPSLIEKLVQSDLLKKAKLKNVYGVEVSSKMRQQEIARIDATTRDPGTLAELKAALNNDARRFALTVAEPIVVDRLLRDRFENDDALHAPVRRKLEQTRESLLAARASGHSATNLIRLLRERHPAETSETTWQLQPRPSANESVSTQEAEIKKRFGPEARILSSPDNPAAARKQYFEDLPPDLQKVLRVQLRRAGDISAVIETSTGFALFLCREITTNALVVGSVTLRKRGFEEWLAE